MEDEKTRTLLVYGRTEFRITIPADAKITFGPFAPPTRGGYEMAQGRAAGTLRIYDKSKERCIACFSPVSGFRDLAMNYEEKIAVEEGASVWKSDAEGYRREDKVSRKSRWIEPAALMGPNDEEEVPF